MQFDSPLEIRYLGKKVGFSGLGEGGKTALFVSQGLDTAQKKARARAILSHKPSVGMPTYW
jgi:hypothetical protein